MSDWYSIQGVDDDISRGCKQSCICQRRTTHSLEAQGVSQFLPNVPLIQFCINDFKDAEFITGC